MSGSYFAIPVFVTPKLGVQSFCLVLRVIRIHILAQVDSMKSASLPSTSRKQEKMAQQLQSDLVVPLSQPGSITGQNVLSTPTKKTSRISSVLTRRSPVSNISPGNQPSADALFERDVELPAEHVLSKSPKNTFSLCMKIANDGILLRCSRSCGFGYRSVRHIQRPTKT